MFSQINLNNLQIVNECNFLDKKQIKSIGECDKLLIKISPDITETEEEHILINLELQNEEYVEKLKQTKFIQKKFDEFNRLACKIFCYDSNFLSTKRVPYLNGSKIQTSFSPHSFISTQAPKENTVSDHFSLMDACNSTTLITLVMSQEPKKTNTGEIVFLDRCEPYWTYKNINIHNEKTIKPILDSMKEISFENTKQKIVIREFPIFKGDELHSIIMQYHYENWPDHGTPELPIFKEFIKVIYQKILEDRFLDNGPSFTHCHAGSGRTGILIACCMIMDHIERQKKLGKELKDISINIPKLILEMKTCRSMLNNIVQIDFIKEWLKDYVDDQLKKE